MPQPSTIRIEINNVAPVELGDLAESFKAFGAQFEKQARKNHPVGYPVEAKLYVKELKKGSIIAELMTYAPPILIAAYDVNTVVEFGSHLSTLFTYFLTPKSKRTQSIVIDKEDCDNTTKILNVIAKDSGSNANFITSDNSTLNINNLVLNIDSTQAGKIIASASLEKNKMEQPLAKIVEKAVMVLFQARNEMKSTTGDRGIIETITKKDKKVIFANDDIKSKIMNSDENVFKYAYVVTVSVETASDKILAYKILELHEKFEIDE